MPVSGLGERGTRLRSVARRLEPAPAVPPFYVQTPDHETRAPGWYMRLTRDAEPEYLGHNAAVAEVFLLRLVEDQAPRPRRSTKRRQKGKQRSTA